MTGFKKNTLVEEANDLSKYGKDFQIKLLSLLVKDRPFAFSILPIIKDVYFADIYLRNVYSCVNDYVTEYNTTPNFDNVKIMLKDRGEKIEVYNSIIKSIDEISLDDRDFVIKNTRNFCFTKHALIEQEKVTEALKRGEFESAKKLSLESFRFSGNESAKVYDLAAQYDIIFEEDKMRAPVAGTFPTFNRNSKGGPGAGDLVLIIAPSNFGKCFAKGTKIRMYDSTLKNIEDVTIYDKVMGWDGKSRNVSGVTTGKSEMFEIQQSNGMNYSVNKDHILCLKTKEHRLINYKSQKEKIKHAQLQNDEQYINITVEEYLKRSKNWKGGVSGYKAPQEYNEKKLLIDPYYLGLWLGDGISMGTVISNIDYEVSDFLKEYVLEFPDLQYKERDYNKPGRVDGHAIVRRNGFKNGGKNKLLTMLQNYNLINNKHIPNDYLFASRKQRLQLLAGLMDSDGHLEKISKTCFQISQVRKDLAWQIYILASGLGFKTKYDHTPKTKPLYASVTIMGDTFEIPTKIERKKALHRKKKYDTTMSEIKIIPKGIDQYFGFTIDESERDAKFLLEDYTVVHNSNYAVAVARHANFIGKNVAYFSYEMRGGALFSRYIAGLLDVKQEDLKFNKEEIDKRMKEKGFGLLRVIEDKSANANLPTIKNHIEALKSQGFFTDLIIVDGLNQMKLIKGEWSNNDNDKYEQLTEGLRDLCGELDVPGYASWQSNRSGFSSDIGSIEGIGKAIEVFQKADQVIFFTQSPEQKAADECIAMLLKNRLGKKEIALLCSYNPNKSIFIEKEELNPLVFMSAKAKERVSNTVSGVRDKLRTGLYDSAKK